MSFEIPNCLIDDLDEKSQTISNLLPRRCTRALCFANLEIVEGSIEGNLDICDRWKLGSGESYTVSFLDHDETLLDI